jgi:glycosyltransferase involved in cell wall biosynthesis
MNNRKIRILFTIPNFDTAGSGKALLNIASRLNKDLFEPMICCMHDRGAFFEVVKDSGIPFHIINYTSDMSHRVKGLLRVAQVSKEFRKLKPDIIHSFHYSADYSEALAARLGGIKWIYTKKNMNWGSASKNAWILRTKFANHIIAQNTDMLSEFFPKSSKVTLIGRGVDTTEFSDMSLQSTQKDVLGVNAADKVIMLVANLVPVKGAEVLIAAFKRIYERHKDTKLLIIGADDTEYAAKLKMLAGSLLGQQIFFKGKMMNIAQVVKCADIFVLPTLNEGRREGSPVALLEAMSSGRYVLASNIAGVKDQLRDFPEFLFSAGNAEELTDKLGKALSLSDDQRNLIGEKMRRHVMENFSIENEVKKHEIVYLELMK